ncbi:hypothetical protein BC828DRAFT_404898 [Blastocladiella britannica]|nr:hypothetical protein BC828DRAFT_404898 [Blastocladiella britannica]
MRASILALFALVAVATAAPADAAAEGKANVDFFPGCHVIPGCANRCNAYCKKHPSPGCVSDCASDCYFCP